MAEPGRNITRLERADCLFGLVAMPGQLAFYLTSSHWIVFGWPSWLWLVGSVLSFISLLRFVLRVETVAR